MLRWRAWVLVLLVALAVVPLAACGDDDDDRASENVGMPTNTGVGGSPPATTPQMGSPQASPPVATVAGTVTPSDSSPAARADLDYPTETLQIMAPASPGGGWDTTAREVQRVLQEAVTDQTVEVFNVPGAGGTVGLAQLANEHRDNDHMLMMMGLVMVGAIETNQAPVTLEETTPIARLTTEWEVVVVPASSPYQTLQDLIDDFKADPGAVSWAGGSAGGTDHILVGLIAKAVGVDPARINYIPYSGGGEALAAILGGQVSAGVSGVGEWKGQIEAGELRVLAVSSGERIEALDAPTLKEQGVDVELANWRGIVAPPEISDDTREDMIALMEAMHATPEWQATLEQYGWEDFFLTGDDFEEFLAEEQARVEEVLKDLGLAQ